MYLPRRPILYHPYCKISWLNVPTNHSTKNTEKDLERYWRKQAPFDGYILDRFIADAEGEREKHRPDVDANNRTTERKGKGKKTHVKLPPNHFLSVAYGKEGFAGRTIRLKVVSTYPNARRATPRKNAVAGALVGERDYDTVRAARFATLSTCEKRTIITVETSAARATRARFVAASIFTLWPRARVAQNCTHNIVRGCTRYRVITKHRPTPAAHENSPRTRSCKSPIAFNGTFLQGNPNPRSPARLKIFQIRMSFRLDTRLSYVFHSMFITFAASVPTDSNYRSKFKSHRTLRLTRFISVKSDRIVFVTRRRATLQNAYYLSRWYAMITRILYT